MKDKKTLLVTGASGDIGSALIREVVSGYDRIFALYNHSEDQVRRLQQETGDRVIPLRADFFDQAMVERCIEEICRSGFMPDHIVHLVAPKASRKQFAKTGWAEYETGIQVSIRSIYEILHAFIPNMVKNRYGKIVLMLTSCTLNMPPGCQSSYVTVKYALLGLMKSLSVEYAGKGITVNAVSPGMTETRFLSELPELIVQQNATDCPMGRNLKEQDVIPAFTYLLSDGADMVTGMNLEVTGGSR